MSVVNGAWKMWRTSPGFSQRIVLTPNDDGRSMTAVVERSSDGEKWDADFDMIFSKA